MSAPRARSSREQSLLDEASGLGIDAGRTAATLVFDGNTTEFTYRKILKLDEDGDPLIEQYVMEPSWLGGLWSGDPTPRTLAKTLGINDMLDIWMLDEACTAYESAAGMTFWSEVMAAARKAVA